MNEAVQAETLFIHNLNQDDGVVQASLQYEWRSNIRFKVSADIFYGSALGLFGQFKEQDRLTVSVELGF